MSFQHQTIDIFTHWYLLLDVLKYISCKIDIYYMFLCWLGKVWKSDLYRAVNWLGSVTAFEVDMQKVTKPHYCIWIRCISTLHVKQTLKPRIPPHGIKTMHLLWKKNSIYRWWNGFEALLSYSFYWHSHKWLNFYKSFRFLLWVSTMPCLGWHGWCFLIKN